MNSKRKKVKPLSAVMRKEGIFSNFIQSMSPCNALRFEQKPVQIYIFTAAKNEMRAFIYKCCCFLRLSLRFTQERARERDREQERERERERERSLVRLSQMLFCKNMRTRAKALEFFQPHVKKVPKMLERGIFSCCHLILDLHRTNMVCHTEKNLWCSLQ